MYQGNRNHNNYFIILKNHGIDGNAKFNFAISWNPDKESCHNEENWPKIKIYKMKKVLPEVFMNIISMNIKKENLLNLKS